MAKTRPGAPKKGRSKTTRAKESGSGSGGGKPAKSPAVLVLEAEAAMTQGDVDAALAAARRAEQALEAIRSARGGAAAATANPTNPTNPVLDGVGLAAAHALVGEILLERGEAEAARAALERAAALDPEARLPAALGGGVDKFLYLAQLSEAGGRDSLAWFERGAAALRRAREGATPTSLAASRTEAGSDDGEEETAAAKLGQVLCAMAEVWMTDLSYEAECEAESERLATEATLVAPGSAEAWQTLANVRISQSRAADARAALQRSLDLWAHLLPEQPDHPAVPAFGVRVALVRLLLTVDWLDKAADIAADMLREDEQSVEVWYLAGYAHYLEGQAQRDQRDEGACRASWVDARRCLGRCLRRFAQQAYEDERLGAHAAELLAEVEAAVGAAPQAEQDEEDYEDEWEDEDEGEGEGEGEDEDEEME